MADEATRQPMEESPKAAQAWADYVALGPDRSLAKLVALYRNRVQAEGRLSVPTTRKATLETWSLAFGWQSRLQQIVAQETAAAEARERQRIDEIMSSGFAVVHNRVKALDTLAEAVLAELAKEGDDETPSGFYRKEVKVAANGTAFDQQVFDKAKFDTLRGLLDDLAKEKGERKSVIDARHTITDHRAQVDAIAETLGLPDDLVAELNADADRLLAQRAQR
jgi:hypothetical protein